MNIKHTFFLTFALLLLAFPSIALAQDVANDATKANAPQVSETSASGDTGKNVDESDSPELDPNDKLYWAKMRDIYTFQKKGVQKDGRFSLSLYFGVIPNNIFERYIPVGLRLDYYILENLAIEFASSYDIKISTSLAENLKDPNGTNATGILLGDSQVSHTNLGVLWSPLYGKTSFYQSALNYFDLYLFAGFGLAIVQTQSNFGIAKAETNFKPEGALGAGVTFFVTDHVHLRLDYRQFIFGKVGGGVAIPSEVSVAFGWMF